MKTVENTRIRVTVTDEIWEGYRARAEHNQRLEARDQSVDQVIRGLVLSAAMAKLGNASEAQLLKQEVVVSEEQVKQRARDMLIARHLKQHGKYQAEETLMRLREGHRLSEGRALEAAAAQAWADSQLSPLVREQRLQAAVNLCDHPDKQAEKLYQWRTSPVGPVAEVLELAEQALQQEQEIELSYRERRGDMTDWLIEVIGELPAEIGTSRTQAAPAFNDKLEF